MQHWTTQRKIPRKPLTLPGQRREWQERLHKNAQRASQRKLHNLPRAQRTWQNGLELHEIDEASQDAQSHMYHWVGLELHEIM
mmetsp:Transcript_92548/g.299229  ORF Transcript_92548/g.299229 Transcript_92548/m.299229 type:complete len:83 (+) Transcript_92548:1792-2040(+)